MQPKLVGGIVRRPKLGTMTERASGELPDQSNQNTAQASNRRGRPSRVKEREITEAIIRKALQLFMTDGYGATSMKRISEEAGVASNTLYSRFSDKAALFRAIVLWKVESWKISNPARRVPADASLVAVLEAAALGMLEAMERQDVSAMGRLVSSEAERFPELAIIYREHAMQIGEAEVIAGIEAASGTALTHQQADDIYATIAEAVLGHSLLRVLQEPAGVASTRAEAAARIARVVSAGWSAHV